MGKAVREWEGEHTSFRLTLVALPPQRFDEAPEWPADFHAELQRLAHRIELCFAAFEKEQIAFQLVE